MAVDPAPPPAPQWATASGDAWARRWRDTDAALDALSPFLLESVSASASDGSFNAFEIGCGPGSTTLAVANAFPDAAITACDISPSLVEIARERTAGREGIRVQLGDAEAVASAEGPFDLIFSRHGVMFFDDPARAFGAFRTAAKKGASLTFTCFQDWNLNPWASGLASAAAGRELPKPGREPSGFAFADPDYVRQILGSSGWVHAEPEAISFAYFAGRTVEDALSFLSELGPASRILQALPEEEQPGAIERMRALIDEHVGEAGVVFPAAAWLWSAKAA
jgi:SAM-dependent methyltransferase